MTQTRRTRRWTQTLKNLKDHKKKTKITEGYDLVSEPSFDTNWCEPRDHMVTQPTVKIEIWSRKVEIGLIGVWHNENLPQGTNTIGLSRIMPQSQFIFDKSDSVRSRIEECKNHSHMLKLKDSEVIIIKATEMCLNSLNSSWKINPNRNKKDNRMEQDCFVETHLEPVQWLRWLNMVYLDQIQSVAR